MRVSRIHQDLDLGVGATLALTAEASHYVARVLRLKVDDPVQVFNSRDGEFQARLVSVTRQAVTVKLLEAVSNASDPVYPVHLGLGLSRGERFDYAIQKSTELGVTRITPLITTFCEVRLNADRQQKKMQHWQKVVISACEQCGRSKVPLVDAPTDLLPWLEAHPGGLLLDAGTGSGFPADPPGDSVNLLIGPEGGLSSEEREAAFRSAYQAVRLGPRVLRTETAPVVALTLVQYLYGDLGDR